MIKRAMTAAAILLVLAACTSSTSKKAATSTGTEAPSATKASSTTKAPATTTTKPTPAAQTVAGNGKTSSGPFTGAGGLVVFHLTHTGSANFIVYVRNEAGKDLENLVNEIGNFDGTTARKLGAGTYHFQVEADGPWSITITQPRPASGAALPQTFTGKGLGLAGPFAAKGAVKFQLHHVGDANFIVYVLDVDGANEENLVNEIGNFDGSTEQRLDDGLHYLNVQADGDWSIAAT